MELAHRRRTGLGKNGESAKEVVEGLRAAGFTHLLLCPPVPENAVEFDPTLYGMAALYDDAGNYIYPEGFDPEANDWLPGFEKQREEWERQYAEAQARFEQHQAQVIKSREADAEAAAAGEGAAPEAGASAGGAGVISGGSYSSSSDETSGALATDEALAALREKLAGGQS